MKKSIEHDHDQNLISSEYGRDTPSCQRWGYSSHVFSKKAWETSNLTRLSKSELRQKEEHK